MSEADIHLYSAIRMRFSPQVEINMREISVLYGMFRDEYVIGYRGLYACTIPGEALYP